VNGQFFAPRILIVEDDPEINNLVSRYLGDNGFATLQAFDSRDVDDMIATQPIDLVVLDVNLPTEDGFSVCVRLRRISRLPIIMLTAKSEDLDRILGLEIGADDYMSKPFNPRELLARIRAVLRRNTNDAAPAKTFRFKGWVVDLEERRVFNSATVEILLTSSEFDLLVVLCENPGRVLTRDRLLDLTQGSSSAGMGRSIDISVSRLRRKMEDNPRDPGLIKTVRSGGYFFAAPVEQSC
jgi:two-component system OmpR family response regulator